ncbi:MAG: hypothetical protein ACUVX8_00345 [Candidatus Zipacnadales bacterium]
MNIAVSVEFVLVGAYLVVSGNGYAQTLQPEGSAFVWRKGPEFIRFENGRFTAGMEGAGAIVWHVALWHDDWVYESQPSGTIEVGPTLTDAGSLTLAGTFSAREGSPPVRYTQTITASPEGLHVHYELQKTAALRLPSGVILHLFPSDGFSGAERVWARPSWHSTIGKGHSGPADGLFFELRDGRSLCLTPASFRNVEKDRYGDSKG